MSKSAILFGMAILWSAYANADAMGKGMGVDFSSKNKGPTAAQARSMKADTSVPLAVAVPVELPDNPQCLSGGQPCAEGEQKKADEFKKEKGIQ